MSEFRLLMWMLFVVAVLGILLIPLGYVSAGGGVFGTAAFLAVIFAGGRMVG